MKRIVVFLTGIFSVVLFSGCETLGNLSESVKNKNIAAGSDTWGGSGEVGMPVENGYVPNVSFWFGRRKVWYVSLKKDEATKDIAEIVKASNTPIEINAGTGGVGISNGSSPDSKANITQGNGK